MQPTQEEENDEVPNDIPFQREVPIGQYSNIDSRRNDPTGQEQYIQSSNSNSIRSLGSGQEYGIQSTRRDVPPGQERSTNVLLPRSDIDGSEQRSSPPQPSLRNEPSGEERVENSPQTSSIDREIPGRGNEADDLDQQSEPAIRQILGGDSSNDSTPLIDERTSTGRVVTGSQEVDISSSEFLYNKIEIYEATIKS